METTIETNKKSSGQIFDSVLGVLFPSLQRFVQTTIVVGILIAIYILLQALTEKRNPNFPEIPDPQSFLFAVKTIWRESWREYVSSIIIAAVTAFELSFFSRIEKLKLDFELVYLKGISAGTMILITLLSMIAFGLSASHSSFFNLFKDSGITPKEIMDWILVCCVLLTINITLLSPKRGFLYAILVAAAGAFLSGEISNLIAYNVIFSGFVLVTALIKLIINKGYKFIFQTQW